MVIQKRGFSNWGPGVAKGINKVFPPFQSKFCFSFASKDWSEKSRFIYTLMVKNVESLVLIKAEFI